MTDSATMEYATEADAAEAIDVLISQRLSRFFRAYSEAPGRLMQPRAHQVDKTVRIDRLLVPTTAATRELGWAHGAIGIEIKRSGVKLGPWLAQAMDYARSVFEVGGVWVQPGAVFLWPCEEQYGPIASVMAHNRVGTVCESRWGTLQMSFGQETVLRAERDGTVRARDLRSGRKVGSR